MKLFPLSIILSLVSVYGISQDLRPFNLYNYDSKLINPAYAGLLNEQNYQVQYNGGSGSNDFPYTALTGFSLQLPKLNSGIGGFLWRESVGVYTEDNTSFLYNYQVKLGEGKRLSIGAEIRYSYISIDYSKLNLQGNGGDPLLSSYQIQRDKVVTADFGMVYKTGDFSIGVSTQNLMQSHKQEILSTMRVYSFYSAYELPVRPWLVFKPSAFFRTTFTDSQSDIVELNAVMEFKKVLFVGMQTTMGDFKSFQSYNAGIAIAKRVQLIGVIYSGVYHRNKASNNNIELMVRVVIPHNVNK